MGLGDDGLVVELRGRKGEGVTSAQGKGLKIPYKLRKNRGSQGEAFPGLQPASSRLWNSLRPSKAVSSYSAQLPSPLLD